MAVKLFEDATFKSRKFKVNIMHQVDFPDKYAGKSYEKYKSEIDLGSILHKFGCNFFCYMAIPQIVNGTALTAKQIGEVYGLARESKYPVWKNGKPFTGPAIEHNCAVNGGDHICTITAAILGDTSRKYKLVMGKNLEDNESWGLLKKGIKKDDLPNKNNAWFCIVKFKTGSGAEYGGYHFQLFSGVGNLLYDPARGEVKSYTGKVAGLSFIQVTVK